MLYSEYPSWSAFGVASKQGLIDGAEGKLGPIEKQYNTDIVLSLRTYPICINEYGAVANTAVCITNTDIPGPATSKPSTAVLATSTSFGADGVVVVVDENEAVPDTTKGRIEKFLKGKTVYGPDNSVSRYLFDEVLKRNGFAENFATFSDKDPEIAAQGIQTGKYDAAVLWNPFLLQTLRAQLKGKKVVKVFDSTEIPGEIIDMVVMDDKALSTPEGQNAAKALAATYYALNKNLNDPKLGSETYVELGAEFANLNEEDMRICGKQTKFFGNPAEGVAAFASDKLPATMDTINKWAVARQQVKEPTPVAYRKADQQAVLASTAALTFDPSYMQAVEGK